MRNNKRLLLEQLDRKLEPFKLAGKVQVPEKGWINNIRKSLNMTLEQLANKLNITRQGVEKIEDRESTGVISLKLLTEVAQALDMTLVYGFVPKYGSVENLVDLKAQQMAKKIVLRTNQNMKLEDQGNREEQINKAIQELSYEIKRQMLRSLWD